MNDYVSTFCFLIPGLLLLLLGFYSYKIFYGVNVLISFPIHQRETAVYIKKAGKYSIAIVGAGAIIKFPLKILSLTDGQNINAYKIFPQHKSIKNGQISVTYCQFSVIIPGEYLISVGEESKIVIKPFTIGFASDMVIDDIAPTNLKIMIKEYSSPINYLLMLIGFIIGPMMMLVGVSFLLLNHGIIEHSETKITTVVKYSF